MRKLGIFVVILMVALSASAQDLIVTVNKDTIPCHIIKMDSISVEYQLIKNGIREKNTLPRRYVADFRIAEKNQDDANPANVMLPVQAFSRFRWSFSLGYANRLGKDVSSGNMQFDRLYNNLRDCFSWGTEIQYYFNSGNGIALNVHGVHSSASAQNLYVPEYGQASKCRVAQQIIFVGPAWATRFEADRFVFSGFIALGPIFYAESLMPDHYQAKMTTVSFGLSYGIGGEYKLSPDWAIGLKSGYTMGAASEFQINGRTIKTEEPISLSSLFISTCLSFRTP